MRILEIIPQLSQGGAEKFVVDLTNQLSAQHDVLLVVLHSGDETSFFHKDINPQVKVISLKKKSGMDISLFLKLNKLVKTFQPDVIHTHLRSILYILYAFINNRRKCFIHTVHNDAQMEAGGFLGRMIRNLLFRFGVVPVTISDNSQQSFREFYNMSSELIYNGAAEYSTTGIFDDTYEEISRIRTSPSSRLLLNVARISKQKNQLMLVDAIANLRKQGYDIELIIIGACEDELIQQQILSYKYDFIHVLGSRQNPRDYMKLSDAFCLSSIYEGMPISLIECFSVGAIPVCTPVGGVNDMIIDGCNGILTSNIDENSIQEAILRLLAMSDSELQDMKRNSLLSFEKYSMNNCASQYECLMHRLLCR